MAVESVMGIDLFIWDEWDEVDEDTYQFYEVEFLLPELQKFNKDVDCVTVDRQYNIGIYLKGREKPIELNVGSLKSFREQLNKKYE